MFLWRNRALHRSISHTLSLSLSSSHRSYSLFYYLLLLSANDHILEKVTRHANRYGSPRRIYFWREAYSCLLYRSSKFLQSRRQSRLLRRSNVCERGDDYSRCLPLKDDGHVAQDLKSDDLWNPLGGFRAPKIGINLLYVKHLKLWLGTAWSLINGSSCTRNRYRWFHSGTRYQASGWKRFSSLLLVPVFVDYRNMISFVKIRLLREWRMEKWNSGFLAACSRWLLVCT